MNIFYLDPDPKIAAKWHCDQHLHKMILESAQMLSTVVHQMGSPKRSLVYLPTHPTHPCVKLLLDSSDACLWVYRLCRELDTVRRQVSSNRPHKSMSTIETAMDIITARDFSKPFVPIFCGQESIAAMSIPVHEKYRLYYKFKKELWSKTIRPMTYAGRTEPEWLQSIAVEAV